MGITPFLAGTIISAVTAAGSTVQTATAQKKREKEASHQKHKTKAEIAKEKERKQMERGKSPSQRLLGGRPTLG